MVGARSDYNYIIGIYITNVFLTPHLLISTVFFNPFLIRPSTLRNYAFQRPDSFLTFILLVFTVSSKKYKKFTLH